MRSNKPMNMDIDQLRGWAAFMDKAMIASLVATVMAVTALGLTTWLSFRFSGAVRAHEHAAFDRYKGMASHAVQLEQDVAAARERAAALEQEVSAARQRAVTLEQEVSTTRGRTVALGQEVSAARERVMALEQEASAARERAAAFERAAREANEQVVREANERAARESAADSEKARKPQVDAAEIQQRLAELGKVVREAAARTDPPRPVQDGGLRKYAGTKAAVFVLDQVSDAPAAGSTISAQLGDAGWSAQTWTWKDVAGIVGVVVLVKEDSDPATSEAASALVEALRSTGFNVTKGDWPADWRRFRGALDGPQTPAPTEASIRIVVGAKPR
jgi:hypothetical protein